MHVPGGANAETQQVKTMRCERNFEKLKTKTENKETGGGNQTTAQNGLKLKMRENLHGGKE